MSSNSWTRPSNNTNTNNNGGGTSQGAKFTNRASSSPASRRAAKSAQQPAIEVKSKFDAEFRRFSLSRESPPAMAELRQLVQDMHCLGHMPFTMCYTAQQGDLLPITNDENLRVALGSSLRGGVLRLLIQRKGESWEEKFGYGTSSIDRRRLKGLSLFTPSTTNNKRNYNISQPEDFRLVSAVIDVNIVPDSHRRVRLCKHGSNKPLGFYIRDGTSVRVTPSGVVKVPGIFISRLVPGGLAESTGLLAVNDEVLEVNAIDVTGKTLDQVTDMMVANAHNLIVTVKPANQRATLQRHSQSRISGLSHNTDRSYTDRDTVDSDEDQVNDHIPTRMGSS